MASAPDECPGWRTRHPAAPATILRRPGATPSPKSEASAAHRRTFLSLKELARYSGISVRKLRDYVRLPPEDALPCYRVGKKVRVRRSEFDQWLQRFRDRGDANVTRIVENMVRDFRD